MINLISVISFLIAEVTSQYYPKRQKFDAIKVTQYALLIETYHTFFSNDENTIEILTKCYKFHKWAKPLEEYGYLCLSTGDFNSCDDTIFTADVNISVNFLQNLTSEALYFYAEYYLFLKHNFMAILLSQSDYSMVCCGIKNISENFIAFSALYSSNSSFIVYDKIEKDMNWLRKSAYVQSLDMKITDTGKPLFLSLTSSLALARTENQKKSQISLQRADTTVLTYDLINNFNLELATNEFDDSALQNKKSPAYQQFLKKITIYINKQITIDMPFLIKNIIAINYENFTVVILIQFTKSNQFGFIQLNTYLQNLTAIPFEYNKELIILTPVGKCFLPDLCGGSILKCKKNSFCYQFFSSVYCLCDPGFGLIDSICVPEDCQKNSCRNDQICVVILGVYFCFDKKDEIKYLIADLIVLVLLIASIVIFLTLIWRANKQTM